MLRHVSASQDGLTLKIHGGDRSSLLAFDLDAGQPDLKRLAGFSVKVTGPDGHARTLLNRLDFASGYTAATTSKDREWTPSDEAPFQKFRWGDFPPRVMPGIYRYSATAMLFGAGATGQEPRLESGPSVEANIELLDSTHTQYELGLTRGYLSSQAYAEIFKNANIRPSGPKTINYSTKPFEAQYEWLGGHARELVFAILREAVSDTYIAVDAFTYDLDEPDVIRSLAALGPRLRLYQDNASLHVGAKAMEPKAMAALKSAGAAVKLGHFKRYQHNKMLLLKKNGRAYKVLAGSANFSVRGLYVQANNVFVYDDPTIAGLYEQAFEQAWNDAPGFAKSPIAKAYFPFAGAGIPTGEVAFSPHTSAPVSLNEVSTSIQKADSSVLFAVMELSGGGDVLSALSTAYKRRDIFSYGVTQSLGKTGTQKGVRVFTSSASGELVPFAALDKNVPKPFRKEWSGGTGQVIHDKFVVVDFNDTHPRVFAGSSNLAAGGETSNADNLVELTDRVVATVYAVEAIRLVDHYAFRAAMTRATNVAPLSLQGAGAKAPWWEKYYDPQTRQYRERTVLAR
ncbi:MAG: phospholipase D-like domain-containing protein [Tepidisphaeraceae bacterium]|jgi:hypothetical protein